MLAPINAPALKIANAQWIIGTVTFRKDRSGTHADVMLMPPAAYNPQPMALTFWDRETMHSVAPGGASPVLDTAVVDQSMAGSSGFSISITAVG